MSDKIKQSLMAVPLWKRIQKNGFVYLTEDWEGFADTPVEFEEVHAAKSAMTAPNILSL